MPCNVLQRIQWVYWEQGPQIIASWLQDTYIWLRFSLKAAKLPIRDQGLDSEERLQVLTNKNVDDICNVAKKPGGKNAMGRLTEGSMFQSQPKKTWS